MQLIIARAEPTRSRASNHRPARRLYGGDATTQGTGGGIGRAGPSRAATEYNLSADHREHDAPLPIQNGEVGITTSGDSSFLR